MKAFLLSGLIGFAIRSREDDTVKNFVYRDDIGAFWGIKGYEEQVSEVGTHRGHMHWP
jgi:ubiquinol-cytochrome c reductase cytochrome c1 subunit